MRNGASEQARMNAEPNVTPMIDVLMVLLIIFMVIVPSSRQAIDVQLPAEQASAGGTPIVLEVGPGGRLALNQEPVAEAARRLRRSARSRDHRTRRPHGALSGGRGRARQRTRSGGARHRPRHAPGQRRVALTRRGGTLSVGRAWGAPSMSFAPITDADSACPVHSLAGSPRSRSRSRRRRSWARPPRPPIGRAPRRRRASPSREACCKAPSTRRRA